MSRVLLTVALTGSMLSSVGHPAIALPESRPVAAPAATAPAGPAAGLVTLVTGDRILVRGDGYEVLDNPARRDITFMAYRHEGHLNVIPSDAIGLIGSQLDSQLFDVTALVEMGYGDGRDLGLIIKHDKNSKAAARSSVSKAGGHSVAELPAINGIAVKESRSKAGKLWAELTTGSAQGRQLHKGITKIWLDRIIRTSLAVSVPQVGAPTAWGAGFDGTGMKIGIVDSGIDTTHPDLAGKVVASANFTGEAPEDLMGHGTHVASIAAGTGAASGGQFRGVAPGAQLINAKACQLPNVCLTTAVMQGMQYAADQGADVINMSLGGPDMAGIDPMEELVNNLTASHGVLFVAAAGNTNPPVPAFSVSSPSTADSAVSVGAVDPGDGLAFFSNRGPRVGDTALKPDMTAPGLAITAARSSLSSFPGDRYTQLNGTSMATPHVAGAAAIIRQSHPTWSPAQVKAALMGSALVPSNNTAVFDQGAGRLDIGYGYRQTILADPPSVSLGRQIGPHDDDPVLNRTVTITNTNPTSGVNLTLSLRTQAPGGGPAPAGMFALSTNSLSLLPGGTATFTLTATTSVPAPDGLYGGWIQASGNAGGVHINVPFGVDRSPAGRELTFNNVNRAGEFTSGYDTLLFPITPGRPVYPITSTDGSGPVGPRTEFIEDGDYLLVSAIPELSTTSGDQSILVIPKLTVGASTPSTIDLLAAQAQPVNITVPNPSAVTHRTQIAVAYTTNGLGLNVEVPGQAYTKQLGPANALYPNLMTKVHRSAYVPAPGRLDPTNSTTLYNVAWFPEQQVPTGFTRDVTAAQLAQRTVNLGRNVPGAVGTKVIRPQPGGTLFLPNIGSNHVLSSLPFTRAEFYNTENNIRWTSHFRELSGPSLEQVMVASQDSAPMAYVGGSTGTEDWNKPVYGPSLGSVIRPEDWVVRRGNTITFMPLMLGDSAGHAGHSYAQFPPLPGLSGQVTLKRNGSLVATADLARDPLLPRPTATVPAASGRYTIEATLSRGGPVDLATQVNATWEFTSLASADPNAIVRLPLRSVTFSPNLNANNAAPAGSFAIPLQIAAQPGSPVGGITAVLVQYSTNDGATWNTATVTGSGNNRTATVVNPGSGYVSLKAIVNDGFGNAVIQSTIRAYRAGA